MILNSFEINKGYSTFWISQSSLIIAMTMDPFGCNEIIVKVPWEFRYQALTQEPFVQAMMDKDTGLTHAALSGIRRQSVVDAERLLSYQVGEFLNRKNYVVEAEYVLTVARWHEATDGRGLTEERRSQYNLSMIDYLVTDWMPYIDLNNRDYSLIDINR